jgi:transposase
MQITTIGLDLAKHWFQVHGVDTNGGVDHFAKAQLNILSRRGPSTYEFRILRSVVGSGRASIRPCQPGREVCAGQ